MCRGGRGVSIVAHSGEGPGIRWRILASLVLDLFKLTSAAIWAIRCLASRPMYLTADLQIILWRRASGSGRSASWRSAAVGVVL
jgi:hypothetical protein